MSKRFLSILFVFVCVFNMSTVALATDNTAMVEEENIVLAETSTRSTAIPIRSWNFITNGDYEGSLDCVRTGLYTNRYFESVTSLRVSWDDIHVENCPYPYREGTFMIRLFDITDMEWVDEYEDGTRLSFLGHETTSGSKVFRNLDRSHQYAFFFLNGLYESEGSTAQLSGTFTVSRA